MRNNLTVTRPTSAGVIGPIGVMLPIGVLTGMITETMAVGTMPPTGINQ